MNDLLCEAIAELTTAQAAAVNWQNGALFVLAGPGSGKTRVLTTRIARLLGESPEKSFRILALTYTNKAADEMASRIALLVPDQEERATIGTFHSFCMQLLQQHGAHIGISPDFAIYSLDSDRKEILKEAIRENNLNLEDERFLNVIDKLKSKLIPPLGCAKRFRDPQTGQRIEATYSAYEQALTSANALDFGSLIAKTYELITKYPTIATRYGKTYTYWMFDEFQDTTDGQYRLIKALAGNSFKNIFAVADDDQIIYQWNGASYLQIQKFRTDFSPEEIQLPTNYRCPPSIVIAANKLVAHNTQRTSTKLPLEAGKKHLKFPSHEHIVLKRFSSDDEEANAVAANIAKYPTEAWGEIVVIARNRALLEKAHSSLISSQIKAIISQRRDDFRSPQFQWLTAVLKLAVRPLDKRVLETLVGAFNRWFSIELSAVDILNAAEISSKSYLSEWASLISQLSTDPIALELSELVSKFIKQPSSSKSFVETVFRYIPEHNDASSDISEDRAAWKDLIKGISRSIGRDAPLEKFLQELALRSKEPPISTECVTLMTIHAAKGKEFDHVYLIGLAEDVLPSFQSLKAGENSVEMEEERRNCFVAITRAKESLWLSYANIYRGWPKKPSRFLKEMGIEPL